MTGGHPLPDPDKRDSGASLIMALVFLFALGMIISAVATLATGAFTTSINLGQERASEATAESAATLAIDNIRFNYTGAWDNSRNPATPSTPPIISGGSTVPLNCMPNNTAYNGDVAYCAMDTPAPSSGASRVVQFYVCPSGTHGTTGSPCAGMALLFAVVTFDDLPPNAIGTANLCDSGGHSSTCGLGMTVETWDVTRADN